MLIQEPFSKRELIYYVKLCHESPKKTNLNYLRKNEKCEASNFNF